MPFVTPPRYFTVLSGSEGSTMDTADTQEPNAGSIPDPKSIDQQIVQEAVQDLVSDPPKPFDPRLQHKKIFREHVTGQGTRMIANSVCFNFRIAWL